MNVIVQVVHGDTDEVISLTTWLGEERELRGAVWPLIQPTGATELGSLTEAVTVAVGSGGAGSILASSLITWIKTRPSSVKLLVRNGNKSVELNMNTLEEMRPLLEEILNVTLDR